MMAELTGRMLEILTLREKQLKKDTWYKLHFGDCSSGSCLQHACIFKNASESESPSLMQQRITTMLADDSHQLLYHGSSLENVADVMERGIDLTKGGSKKDFSSKDGFYLHFDFSLALRWARRKSPTIHAVLVFRVPKDMLDPELNSGLDLLNVMDDDVMNTWKSVVKMCRSGYKGFDSEKIELEKYNFIQGPICINYKQFIRENSEPTLFKMKKKLGHQLCVRKVAYALSVGRVKNIVGVIIYT